MRICNAYYGVALAGLVGFAGHAFALDPKSINANTSPQEALQEPGRLVKGVLCTLILVPRQEHPGQGDVVELA